MYPRIVNMNHEKILKNLLILASDNYRFNKSAKLAAAIVYRNETISYGFNDIKTHPLQHKFYKNVHALHLHAEIDELKNAIKRITLEQLKSSTLYIARSRIINNVNVSGNSKPCLGCLSAILAFQIPRVFYTLDATDENIFSFDSLNF